VKDAVCDQLREATGERPSVDTRWPDLAIALHLGPERAVISVDTSGEPLFKRGWREDKGDAPLKETLAAAMLAAAGWRGTPEAGGALHDPCCGSGTIAIEAAQIACGIAPGLQRRFAFERLLPFTGPDERALWQQLKAEAKARIHASAVPIHASDVSFRMVDFAWTCRACRRAAALPAARSARRPDTRRVQRAGLGRGPFHLSAWSPGAPGSRWPAARWPRAARRPARRG